ncbi:MAG: sugar phosphate isomerase/epimerase [Spirochaetaceae bacterium]
MKNLGVQTFTIRELIKTPETLRKTFTELVQIGYKRFELARMKYDQAELDVLKDLQKEFGLEYVTCQIKYKVILKRFDWLMKFSKELNIPTLEVSVIPMDAFLKKEKGMLELSKKLNDLGKRTQEHGVNLLYHHHNFELIPMGSKIGFDHLVDNTDPKLVNFVIDTYWLARSGFDPNCFIDRYISRVTGVHLRDCEFISSGFGFGFKDQKIGAGSINFEPFKEDKYKDINFFSVEQATSDPMADLKFSYNNLMKNS